MTQSLEQEVQTLRSLFWSERDPDGHGFAPLADAYRRLGDARQALELLEDGLNRLPDFTPGHLVAARLYLDQGLHHEAELSARRVAELDPENLEAARVLVDALEGKGDDDAVEEARARLAALEAEEDEEAAEEEEPVLSASAFGEADRGDREEKEYVEPGEEMGVVDVELEDLAASEEERDQEAVADIGALAPQEEAEEEAAVADIGALAPEAEEAEEEAADIGALAPEVEEAEEEAADMGALAPEADELEDEVVDIGAVAPEEPVLEMSDLEPAEVEPEAEPTADVSDIGALAPDGDDAGDVASVVPGEPVLEMGELAPEEEAAEPDVFDVSVLAPEGEEEPEGEEVPEAAEEPEVAEEPQAAEESEEDEADEEDGPPIYTRTMAELYVKQGLVDRAAEVYRALLEQNPGDEELEARLAELETAGDDVAPHVPSEAATEEEEVEALARDLAESGDHSHEVDTPFAWTEAEGKTSAASGPPIGEYFRRLLDWEPGAGGGDEPDEGPDAP